MNEKEKNQLKKEIIEKVLGYSPFGFVDFNGDKGYGSWTEFENKYFFREGMVENESYTEKINRHLSGAAMHHTIEEIKKRIELLFSNMPSDTTTGIPS